MKSIHDTSIVLDVSEDSFNIFTVVDWKSLLPLSPISKVVCILIVSIDCDEVLVIGSRLRLPIEVITRGEAFSFFLYHSVVDLPAMVEG